MIITSILVAATSATLTSHFETFSQVGGIIGTSVSAGLLLVLGLMNGWVLLGMCRDMRRLLRAQRRRRRGRGVEGDGEREGDEEGDGLEMVGSGAGVREVGQGEVREGEGGQIEVKGGGCLTWVFGWAFKMIDRCVALLSPLPLFSFSPSHYPLPAPSAFTFSAPSSSSCLHRQLTCNIPSVDPGKCTP